MLPENNFGTYITYKVPTKCHDIFIQYISYNSINKNEYPEITKAEKELTTKLSIEFCQGDDLVTGVATTGSTEAAMIALLNAKRKWENYNNENIVPNIVLDINSHHSWERIASYLGVETRYWIPNNPENGINQVDKNDLYELINKDTILIIPCLGYTTLGVRDDIEFFDNLVNELHKLDSIWKYLHIHVDAAIGGFTWKYYEPLLNWGFKLKNVGSINLSNHKYGLSYCGLGWCLFKNEEYIHESLYKETDYLAGDFKSIGFSFSKNAAQLMSNYHLHCIDYKIFESCISSIKNYSNILQKYIDSNINLDRINNTTSPGLYWTGDRNYLESKFKSNFDSGLSFPVSDFETKSGYMYVQRLIPKYGHNFDELVKYVENL